MGKHTQAYTSTGNIQLGFSAVTHFAKPSEIQIADTNPGGIITGNHCLGTADDYLICDDDDNEDEDIINKHILPARYLLIFYYTFITAERCTFIAETLTFSTPSSFLHSCKYIAQRVIRI
ncbi:MAG: hypothetical protein ABIU30_11570 [Ferruginibacter sp.]